MSFELSRDWNLGALTAAGAPMPRETLAFSVAFARIRSVTMDNGSNCDCGIFIDRDPVGQPNFIVPGGTYKTNPISAQRVGVAFNPPQGDQPRGQVYAHLTDTALSASSGVSAAAGSATFVWDQSLWDSGAKFGS